MERYGAYATPSEVDFNRRDVRDVPRVVGSDDRDDGDSADHGRSRWI